MAKAKAKKNGQVPGKHLRDRISYLHQAAAYLHSVSHDRSCQVQEGSIDSNTPGRPHPQIVHLEPTASADIANVEEPFTQFRSGHQVQGISSTLGSKGLGQPRRFNNHIRAISLKSQIRVPLEIKHSICKRCDNLFVVGSTATHKKENKSRGGKKPWAEVLVTSCNTCGTEKRFPIGAKRQSRRTVRKTALRDTSKPNDMDVDQVTQAKVNG